MTENWIERDGWRDHPISLRRRLWGVDCPEVAIAFLLVDCDHGAPRGIVEYRHENAAPPDLEHPSMRTLIALANASEIPFLCVRYADDFAWFEPTPMNRKARELDVEARLSEAEWIALLRCFRSRVVPLHLQDGVQT